MKSKYPLVIALAMFVVACTTNAITGRRQLSLISEDQLQQEAVSQYRSFLSQNNVVSTSQSRDAEMVKRVGRRIADAITKYYAQKGASAELSGYKWEFNLVKGDEINAWCMPGGKVVVYTGLLDVTKNEAALAIVMGHEIAHAVASHGQERISQQLAAQGIGVLGDVFTSGNSTANDIFRAVYAPGAQIGVLLPNSRSQELEADHYGLIFAAMAGYNPQVAIPFWQRMAAMKKGNQPPEILSTHPLDSRRIEELKKHMDEALKYYQPVKN